MDSLLGTLRGQLGKVLGRPAPTDPAAQRYIDFNTAKWHQDWEVRDDAVVLVGVCGWKPLIHCYSYAVNHLARESKASIEAFNFQDKRDPTVEKVYASFGARVGLSFEHAEAFRIQARVQADAFFAGLRDKWDVVNITLEGVVLGDLIYDTYLRQLALATLDLRDERLRTLIFEALLIFYAARAYFTRKRPVAIIVDHLVYTFCGVLIRVATQAGVPVLLAYYDPKFFLYQVNGQDADPACQVTQRWPFWKYHQLFSELEPVCGAAALERGRLALQSRLSGKNDGVLRGQSAYEAASSSVLMADTGRPRVLVLLHDFCDAVHVFRSFLFPDFYEWIHFVLRKSAETPFDWYVKPHPNNNERSRAAMNASNNAAVEELKRAYPHVRFLEPSASNKQLVAEGLVAMFTGRGTAGHEFAYMGVPVVNAGDSPHIDYGFNLHPSTLDEFERCIYKADRLELENDPSAIEEFFYMNYFHFTDQLGAAPRSNPLEAGLASNPALGYDAQVAAAQTACDESIGAYLRGFAVSLVRPQFRPSPTL